MKNIKYIDVILWILWAGMAAVAIELSIIIITKPIIIGQLISAIAILISAAVASASIMKSIAETKAHDIAKSEKEILRKKMYVYNIMHTIWITMSSFQSKVGSLHGAMSGAETEAISDEIRRDLKLNSESVKKLVDSIFVENILPYLTDEQQDQISELQMFFYEFCSTHIDMPKMSLSPQERNESAIREYAEFKILIHDYISNNHKERS